jgi:DNA-binding PadR family transcriptional regulator
MSPRQKTSFTYEHTVLGFLLEAPMHAYALHQTVVDSPLGNIWHIKQSAFYAIVARMQEVGFLCAIESDDDGRGKRMLGCTPVGQAKFARWCSSPVAHPRDMRIEFLSKLYFCSRRSPAAIAALYDQQTDRCQRWLDDIVVEPHADQYRIAVMHYRRGQIQATIQWLEACRMDVHFPTYTPITEDL